MGPPWGEIWLGNFALQNKKNETGHRAVTDGGGTPQSLLSPLRCESSLGVCKLFKQRADFPARHFGLVEVEFFSQPNPHSRSLAPSSDDSSVSQGPNRQTRVSWKMLTGAEATLVHRVQSSES